MMVDFIAIDFTFFAFKNEQKKQTNKQTNKQTYEQKHDQTNINNCCKYNSLNFLDYIVYKLTCDQR